MKLKHIIILLLLITLKSFSQDSNGVLFSIDDERYFTNEFVNIYKKNSNQVKDSKDDVEDYLKLYIDFKLKVKEARLKGLDTINKYKEEIKQYKSSLIVPYLKDEKVTNNLVKEAYDRLKKEVNASHILILLKSNASPKDTLEAYSKLIEARNLVLNGKSFSDVAKKYSQDPSVKQNEGEIGFFTALQMVYPFENVAFNTEVDNVSLPFRTKFGYHILKINDIRKSNGKVEVAHVMFKNNSSAKKRIDSVYKVISESKQDFFELAKNISEDKASAVNGGRLKKFGNGQMVEEFTTIAFSIDNVGDFSKPFKTKFGWHIIKLLKKYPLKDFDKLESELKLKVEKDSRSNLIGKSIVSKLENDFDVVIDEELLQKLNLNTLDKSDSNLIILSINNKKIKQSSFTNFISRHRNLSAKELFQKFKAQEILEYYKENIEHTNSSFAAIYKEFKEGLLLFDLLDNEVWEKAKDSIGLSKFYNVNQKKYLPKELKEVKGKVISDYQKELELLLSNQLKAKYKVKINKSEKKKLKNIIL